MIPEVQEKVVQQVGWNEEQTALIKRTVAEGTTDDEFAMFLHYCKQSGLDPLRRQAHCIVREWTDKRGNNKRNVTMMTGIDGFRGRAESFPDFLGCQSGVVFDGDDFSIDYGQNVVNHIAKFPRKSAGPIGAWAIVMRVERKPYIHWLSWAEIFDSFSPMHKKMPEVMAKKTVEAQAIRHEYPEPFSGVYDPSEIPREGEHILTSMDNSKVLSDVNVPGGVVGESGSDADIDSVQRDGEVVSDAVEHEHISKNDQLDTAPPVEVEAPTDAQIERWIDITDWAEEVGLMTEDVHETALAWLEGPPKPSTRAVGAKIGVWKARRDRYDSEWDSVLSVMSDSDAHDDDKLEAKTRLKGWVMNPKTKIDGKENSPDTIIRWLIDRSQLPL